MRFEPIEFRSKWPLRAGAAASNWLPQLDITSVDYGTSIIAEKTKCQRNHIKLGGTSKIGRLRILAAIVADA